MKSILLSFFFLFLTFHGVAQKDTTVTPNLKSVRIIKTDGGELIGKILSQDSREVLLLTNDNRQIYVPQYIIKEIIEVNSSDFNQRGEFVGEDSFATRYFITTNGLPIKKGEHYIQWNLFGPDFQFGLGKNFGVGIMTSWVGMPIIGTIKKSWQLRENVHLAIGGLVGSGTWAAPRWGGALPFGTLSYGDRKVNIAISGGYGAIFADGETQGRALGSLAGMAKVGKKLSVVFDSFILLPNDRNGQTLVALIIPGLRYHQAEGKAFQFGFTGVFAEGDLLPFPIPMVQWYRSF